MTHNTSPFAWGVDGCKAGWFWFRLPLSPAGQISCGVVKKLQSLFEKNKPDQVGEHDLILVDIPIGLPMVDKRESAFRQCDKDARKELGTRKSSVFPVPCRGALKYLRTVLEIGRTDDALGEKAWKWKNARSALNQRKPAVQPGEGRMTAQSFAILSKIAEVDDLLGGSPPAKQVIRETHPEICFWALNGKRPMRFAKKHGVGFLNRVCVLEKCREGAMDAIFAACRSREYRSVGSDDIVDAMACAVTASLALGSPRAFPATIRNPIGHSVDPLDSKPMIVYAEPPPDAARRRTSVVLPCFK